MNQPVYQSIKMENTPDIFIFLGRFHPLVVHLPIGFVCIALLAELFFRQPKYLNLQPLVKFIWLLAALSSTIAVVAGYLLSLQGGYDEKTLSWHKWSGILLALFIHVCYFWKKGSFQKPVVKYLFPTSLVLCLLLLVVTGHYGGSLTHGSGYLTEYKPNSFSELIGISPANEEFSKKINSLDSADIFADAVVPILKSKCYSCHNAEKKKGELILTSFEEMVKGGEDGAGVVAGNLEKSGIYRRITLPEGDKKFMPADGKKPLTPQQVAIIQWWIEKRAPGKGMITELKPDSAMRKTLIAYFGIGEQNSNLNANVSAADEGLISELTKQGFLIATLAEKNNLLQATYNGSGADKINLNKLVDLKDQLVWLRISNAENLNDQLKIIGQLTNLQKLTLNNNDITDKNISELLALSNLEYLNLYNTKLSNEGVETLMQLKKLKHLYVGKTNILPSAIDSLSGKHPNVSIVYQEPVNEVAIGDSLISKK